MINSTSVIHKATAAALGAAALVATVGVSPADASPSVCKGIKHCTVVASIDITGDKIKDTVAIAPVKRSGVLAAVQVRVLTGKGSLFTYTDHQEDGWPTSDPIGIYRGATWIDGRPGADIIIGHTAGAHATYWRVVGYRNHKLAAVNAPKLPKQVGVNTNGLWYTDSSASSIGGVKRTTHNGRAQVKLTVGLRDLADQQKKFDTWATIYRWNGHGWHRVSTKHRSLSQRKAFAASGWDTKLVNG